MHTFLYQFKLLLRNRVMIFWTLIFPLILATFFYLALSSLYTSESFQPAQLAVVVEKENQEFQSLLDELSKESDQPLLDIQYVSQSQASDLLIEQKVDGYLLINDQLQLTFLKNGISQTIIQSVVDSYLQMSHTFASIEQKNPQALRTLIEENINMNQDYFDSQNPTSLNVIVVYFYTLIGMTCMYGGFWGLEISSHLEANLSRQGTRIQCSPVSKGKMIFTGMLAAFVCQYVSMIVLLIYLIYGLHVEFTHQIGLIMLLMAIGSYVGITIGYCIGCIFKCSENVKLNILTAFSMICSFLAGMMVIDLKYLIHTYVPLLAYLNPVNLITDALYALYYYQTNTRFFFNLFILMGIGFVSTLFSIYISRRKQYDSL